MRLLKAVFDSTCYFIEKFGAGGGSFAELSLRDWIVGGLTSILLLATFVVSFIVLSWVYAIVLTIGVAASICLVCILIELVIKLIRKLTQKNDNDTSHK